MSDFANFTENLMPLVLLLIMLILLVITITSAVKAIIGKIQDGKISASPNSADNVDEDDDEDDDEDEYYDPSLMDIIKAGVTELKLNGYTITIANLDKTDAPQSDNVDENISQDN